MKLIYLKSALKFNSFDVTIGIKIPFFRVLVTIEPSRCLIKRFVMTKCCKERRGSLVAESLINGISIPIDPLKELAYYADFKYIRFIKFSLPIKRYEPEKIYLILEKRGKHPLKVKYS